MNCPRSEIAQYAGGDLPPQNAARVQAHLASCAECRALLKELRTGQVLLSELRDDSLEDAMVAQVRRRVLADIAAGDAARGGIFGYWKFVLAAAAAILIVLLVWPRHVVRKHMPVVRYPQMAHVEPAPHAPAPLVPVRHASVRRHRRASVRRAPSPDRQPSLLVQFVTEDPNVVIYWLVDQTPQGD